MPCSTSPPSCLLFAEGKPQLAWKIGVDGLWNVLEVARQNGCSVFTPSSIACFGPETPADNTPQDTIQRPRSIYGVTKVTTELLSDYYFRKYGVDTRSVRFPGLISYVTPPGGGTTDYAVDIYYSAVKGEKVYLPHRCWHLHGHDVYARCFECLRTTHGSQPRPSHSPQ